MTKTAHKSLFVAIFAAMIMMFALIGGSVQAAPSASEVSSSVTNNVVYAGAQEQLRINLPSASYSAATIKISDNFGGTYSIQNLGSNYVSFNDSVLTINEGSHKSSSVVLNVAVGANATPGTAAISYETTGFATDNMTAPNFTIAPLSLSASTTATYSTVNSSASKISVAALSGSGSASATLLDGYSWNVTSSVPSVAGATIAKDSTMDKALITVTPATAGTTVLTAQLVGPTINGVAGSAIATKDITVTVNDDVTLTDITVSPTSKTLNYGETQQITTYFTPAGATNKALTYTSSNDKVATVSSTGLITAVGQGTATITVKSNAKANLTKNVTVNVNPLAATGVSITPATGTVYITPSASTTTSQLTTTAVVAPTGAAQDVTWTLKDSKGNSITTASYGSASLAFDGTKNPATITLKATAVKADYAKIVKAVNDAGLKLTATTKTGKFTATQNIVAAAPVMNTLTMQSNGTNVGNSSSTPTTSAWNAAGVPLSLVSNVYAGAQADLSTATWTVTNPNGTATDIATITDTGATNTLVFAKEGMVKVTATAYGVTTTGYVSMTAPALTGFTLDPASTTLYLASDTAYPSTYTLTAVDITGTSANIIGTPAGSVAGSASYTFSSQNPNIATVNTDKNAGIITAVKAGTTNIFVNATLSDGTALAPQTFVVTVVDKPVYPSAMTVEPTVLDLKIGGNSADETATLTATFAPATTTNQNVNYVSNAPNVAKVDAKTGVVTAVGEGKATITATSVAKTAATNGKELTQTIPVTVTKVIKPTSVTITPDSQNVAVGKSASFAATVAPANADKSVIWTSSNEKAATIDANGVVTGVAVGHTVITATSAVDNTILDTAELDVQAYEDVNVTITASTTANVLVAQANNVNKVSLANVTGYNFYAWSLGSNDMQADKVMSSQVVNNNVACDFDMLAFQNPDHIFVDVYALTADGAQHYVGGTIFNLEQSGVLNAYGIAGVGHVQDIGWMPTVSLKPAAGGIVGTTGQAKRLEAFKIALNEATYPGVKIAYQVTYSDGTSAVVTNGAMAGTTGQSKSILGVQMYLTGDNAANYNFTYDVHFANDGWKTGSTTAATTSNNNQVEAIRVNLTAK